MVFAYWELLANFLLGIAWPFLIGVLGWRYGPKLLEVIRSFSDRVEEASLGRTTFKLAGGAFQEELAVAAQPVEHTNVSNEKVDVLHDKIGEINNKALDEGMSDDVVDLLLKGLTVAASEIANQDGFVELPDLEKMNADEVRDWALSSKSNEILPILRSFVMFLSGAKGLEELFPMDELILEGEMEYVSGARSKLLAGTNNLFLRAMLEQDVRGAY